MLLLVRRAGSLLFRGIILLLVLADELKQIVEDLVERVALVKQLLKHFSGEQARKHFSQSVNLDGGHLLFLPRLLHFEFVLARHPLLHFFNRVLRLT